MEIIGTGLGLNLNQTSDGLTGLGVVILESNLGFADGVEVGIDNDNAENWILVIGAVELKVGSREVLAIDENLAAALGIFSGRVAPADELLGAGREQLKVGEVAIQDWEFRNIGLVKLDVHVGAVSLKLRNFAGDFHGLRNGTNLETGVGLYGRVRGDGDAGDVVPLEAGGFDVNLVGIRD